MTSELHRTQVNIEGLLEVLGKNLYSTPVVAVRELVQNSHDACIRRQVEQTTDFEPTIRLYAYPDQNRLVVEDNGAGLTREEVINYLATIGSGYTRQLRQADESVQAIGYFGLGFLSAYVVASQVEVHTTSYQDPDSGWRFSSNDGQRYTVEPADPRPTGTSITLQLDSGFHELGDPDVLEHVLQRYCSLLPINIHMFDRAEAVNNLEVPWRLDTGVPPVRLKKSRMAFADVFETTWEPLCTIPLQGDDKAHLQGLAWIHDGSSYANSDQRSATVFIRNMFITDRERELLPDWAGFASCVIESDNLLPTASREDLQQDETYESIREMISEQLINGLVGLSQSEPETFQRILMRHNEQLRGAAISDERLFNALVEKLKIPTSEGELTIQEILAQSRNRQFNITLEEKGGYESILCEATKTPVIYGYRYAVYQLITMYAELRNIKIAVLGTKEGNARLFNPERLEQSQHDFLVSMLTQEGEKLIPTRFEPEYIPILLVPDEEVLLKRRIESDDANKRIGTAALSLARTVTNQISDEVHTYIYVNLDSALIRELMQLQGQVAGDLGKLLRSFALSMSRGEHMHQQYSLADELQRYSEALLKIIGRKATS